MTSFQNIRCDYCKNLCSFMHSDDMKVSVIIINCRCGNQMAIGDITMIHPSLMKHARKMEDIIRETSMEGLTPEQQERMKGWKK